MNMPVDEKGRVHFATTLFALVRESLAVRMGPGDDDDDISVISFICSTTMLAKLHYMD